MLSLIARSILLSVICVCLASGVEPGLPSRTSVTNIAHRAVGAKHPDPKFRNPDYLAAKFLGPRERALLPDNTTAALDLDYEAAMEHYGPIKILITNHLLRTRHIDVALEDAIRNGARQVVILGAGFDA